MQNKGDHFLGFDVRGETTAHFDPPKTPCNETTFATWGKENRLRCVDVPGAPKEHFSSYALQEEHQCPCHRHMCDGQPLSEIRLRCNVSKSCRRMCCHRDVTTTRERFVHSVMFLHVDVQVHQCEQDQNVCMNPQFCRRVNHTNVNKILYRT